MTAGTTPARSSPEVVGQVTALLGATNTGKTHRAIERMLAHGTGLIGLPLRLLAREVYDRVTAKVGERAVALVTGEEKRIPERPSYWVCTVEAMPMDRPVDFVAIDEIQLCEHPQRGHVFTDRLLHARGGEETWFLGADTMAPLLQRVVPTAQQRRHPRLSRLRAVGELSLRTLPPRSAVVAFSAEEVYRIADRLRRRRGGTAVVFGALSPRTRNAQVAMYQSGEVDFLVATDAIGMGLNMDVQHVAFASLRKFDGRRSRSLTFAELGQIAGRAGRYTTDGTFGTLSPQRLSPEAAAAIELHRFAPVTRIVWRNSELDFSGLDPLMRSLTERPRRGELARVEEATDEDVLRLLSGREEIRERVRGEDELRLLWELCQIPDYRKLLPEHHSRLVQDLFLQLSRRGWLEPDFIERHVSRLERDGGDLDTLMVRIEGMRTWSYIAHHAHWVRDADHWQARTRDAEDRLSDALHHQLLARFVERKRRAGPRARPRARQSAPRGPVDEARVDPSSPFAKLAALRVPSAPSSVEVVRDRLVDAIV
ncbi:MAG: helicase-related protein, partial [Myxococcota bacterium]